MANPRVDRTDAGDQLFISMGPLLTHVCKHPMPGPQASGNPGPRVYCSPASPTPLRRSMIASSAAKRHPIRPSCGTSRTHALRQRPSSPRPHQVWVTAFAHTARPQTTAGRTAPCYLWIRSWTRSFIPRPLALQRRSRRALQSPVTPHTRTTEPSLVGGTTEEYALILPPLAATGMYVATLTAWHRATQLPAVLAQRDQKGQAHLIDAD